MNHLDHEPASLDAVKDRVIVGNNAHTIYDHIKSLENEPKNRQRWIWELMQNAQDEDATEIEIEFGSDQVTFSHNGKSFTEEDITHLIFHGSSKPDRVGKTGKFGTGFMTTHLLSKNVIIRGNLDGERSFEFTLTRVANSPKEMANSLNVSWDNFKKSIPVTPTQVGTSFSYVSLEAPGQETVNTVYSRIPDLLPIVMIFCKGIQRVLIKKDGVKSSYIKANSPSQNELTIEYRIGTELAKTYSYILRDLPTYHGSLVIVTDEVGNFSLPSATIPRLFLTFPLIGTDQALPLPFIINCQNFEPSPEREKLWLSESDTAETRINKLIIEEAFTLYEELLKDEVFRQRGNKHYLADIGAFTNIDWIDPVWQKKTMASLISKIDEVPLVSPSLLGTENIPLAKARIPISELNDERTDAHRTWVLCNYLFPDIIPQKNEFVFWKNVLKNRQTFLEEGTHPSAFTLMSVCQFIDNIDEHKLSAIPVKNVNALGFLQTLVFTLEAFKLERYWSEYAILPNQQGDLKKSNSLQQEVFKTSQEIGHELKSISNKLGMPVIGNLLHEAIKISSENHKLSEYKKDTLVASLLQLSKNLVPEHITEHLEDGLLSFFKWLIENEAFNDLIAFPIKMASGKWDRFSNSKEPYLCPVLEWPQEFHPYTDLFPNDFILHNVYSEILNGTNLLQKVADKKLLLRSPLYLQPDVLKSSEIRTLLTRRSDKDALSKVEDADWQIKGEINFSKIAYFNLPKDKNVIDKARASFKRTKQLLEFVVDVLLPLDTYGFRRKEVIVNSNNIQETVGIYPSLWLLELKNREWIKEPSTSIANKPSVETILPYFSPLDQPNILYSSLMRQEVSRFLHFLDIGVGDLLRNIRAGGNEDERISWDQSYVSILMNTALTPQKVTDLLGDPSFLAAFEEKQALDKLREQNSQIGTAVESAFEKAFEGIAGYRTKREPIGSDYVVECDFPHYLLIDQDNQQKFVIEIKSARANEVRMTKAQGDKAYVEKENYILCVVPLTSELISVDAIIANAMFVTDISTLLANRIEKVQKISVLQSEVNTVPDLTNGQIWTSIEGTNIRYVIGKRIWERGQPTVLDFSTFINGIKSSKPES